MGDPAMQGMPAASDAQVGSTSFPADTAPGGIAAAMGAAQSSDSGWRDHYSGNALGDNVGTPVRPDERQVTPVEQMGAGYREADPASDPW